MAKQSVTHSCGHEQTYQMYGPHKDRNRKAAWLAGGPCDACIAAKRAAEAAKAADAAKADGLPALAGSPKQIVWAETIRRGKLAEIAAKAHECPESSRAAFAAALAALRAINAASWWIDHRNSGLSELLHAALKASA